MKMYGVGIFRTSKNHLTTGFSCIDTAVIMLQLVKQQGRIQDFSKGGSLRSSYAYGMRSMPILGGSGGMPPRKFLKITLSEIDSGAF